MRMGECLVHGQRVGKRDRAIVRRPAGQQLEDPLLVTKEACLVDDLKDALMEALLKCAFQQLQPGRGARRLLKHGASREQRRVVIRFAGQRWRQHQQLLVSQREEIVVKHSSASNGMRRPLRVEKNELMLRYHFGIRCGGQKRLAALQMADREVPRYEWQFMRADELLLSVAKDATLRCAVILDAVEIHSQRHHCVGDRFRDSQWHSRWHD